MDRAKIKKVLSSVKCSSFRDSFPLPDEVAEDICEALSSAGLAVVPVEPSEPMTKTICKSGRFETGHGTCAALCMDQLGEARKKCPHTQAIHGDLLRAAIKKGNLL